VDWSLLSSSNPRLRPVSSWVCRWEYLAKDPVRKEFIRFKFRYLEWSSAHNVNERISQHFVWKRSWTWQVCWDGTLTKILLPQTQSFSVVWIWYLPRDCFFWILEHRNHTNFRYQARFKRDPGNAIYRNGKAGSHTTSANYRLNSKH
jgi:hypothetical protein